MNKLKLFYKDIARIVFQIIGAVVPVKSNRILFYSFTGSQYSCSPKYISEYINSNFPNQFELVWAFRKNNVNRPTYCKCIKYQSLSFFYYHLSAKYIISNIYPYHLIGTKKNQIMIDTWHGGGAYKVSGFDFANGDEKSVDKRIGFYRDNISVFLSSSELFTKYFIRGGMRFSGKVLASGLPRNDIFFWEPSKQEHIREKVYNRLHISHQCKLFLYAPTWRSEEDSKDFLFDTAVLKRALSERFGGEWKILVRMHMYTSTHITGDVIDVKNYPDMQELLLASDMLVSDYSSAIWDYSLTRKACFLYAYDLDKYVEGRSFYVDIDQWGFPICRTFEDLIHEIKTYDAKEFAIKMQRHYDMLKGYDTGHACETVVNYIVKMEL